MNFKPLRDQVLVEGVVPVESKTEGGIVVPGHSANPVEKGKVVAVGDGRYSETGFRIMMTVYPGQEVLFPKGAGSHLSIEGKSYLLLNEGQIFGVLNSTPA